MQVERQSETYGSFEGRTSTALPEPKSSVPESAVKDALAGPRVTPGLNNRRQGSKLAVESSRRTAADAMNYQFSPEQMLNPASMMGAPRAEAGGYAYPTHTYSPGHRIGLPYQNYVIPGTVTHLDGNDVGVRWDDGQHSVEEPASIHLL